MIIPEGMRDSLILQLLFHQLLYRDEITLSRRNFNPETRTIRKRDIADAETEETVEKTVEGMAEKIIADDEKRRVQELVRTGWSMDREAVCSLHFTVVVGSS